MNKMNIKKFCNNTKGITLVALIVTIIVILILSGVTLYGVIHGGILEKATSSIDLYKEKEAEKIVETKLIEIQMKYPNLDSGPEKLKIIADEFCTDALNEFDWVKAGRGSEIANSFIDSTKKIASINELKISTLPLIDTQLLESIYVKPKSYDFVFEIDEYGEYSLTDEEYDVLVGGVKYKSFEDALEKTTDGATVSLLKNLTVSDQIVIQNDQNIQIDLNRKVLKSTYAGPGLVNNGTLTITGNGKIYTTNADAQGRDAVRNYGTLTIESGTFGSNKSRGPGLRNYGTTIINNGTFTACDNYLNGGFAYAIVNEGGNVTINNATVSGNMNGIIASNNGNLTINDGTFDLTGTKSYYGIYIEKGHVEVNGGTFRKSGNNRVLFYGGSNTASTGTLTINAGLFQKNNPATGSFINFASAENLKIKGGSFSHEIATSYLEQGYSCTKKGDLYVVNQGN